MSYPHRSILRMPRNLLPLKEMLADIGRPTPKELAKALGVTERTVWRWLSEDSAPRPVLLAIFWLTRWGVSEIDCEAHNVATRARGLQDELDSIRERLARVAKIGDFGSSNDPAPEFSTNSMKPFQAGKTGYGLTIKPGQPQVKPGEQSAVEPSNHAGFQQKGYYQSAIRVRYAA